VRSAAPNARPRASSFLLQILALHRRHVNRVLRTVPSGAEIGLPPQIEQKIDCGMTSLETAISLNPTSQENLPKLAA
jgi:hypothetical protein